MKQTAAILLMGLLTFSQYIRPLSYLECKFTNLFKAETVKCECEKKAGYEKPFTGEAPVPKTHTHLHLDEYFAANKEIQIGSFNRVASSGYNTFPQEEETEGCGPAPWQPPNS